MWRVVCYAILAAFAPFLAGGAATALELTVSGSDPGFETTIGREAALYLRFDYRSDTLIRAQARGYFRDAAVDNGAKFNPAPPYPAGSGEGLVWVAYDEPVRIDEIRIEVSDESWHPLAVYKLPVDIEWTEHPADEMQRAAWVSRLNEAQQSATGTSMTAWQESLIGGVAGWLLGSLFMLGVPGYFVLQFLFGIRWRGGWRIAALAPLVLMVPALGHAMFALAAESNLWPIVVILVAPFAFLYLTGLFVARRVVAAA